MAGSRELQSETPFQKAEVEEAALISVTVVVDEICINVSGYGTATLDAESWYIC